MEWFLLIAEGVSVALVAGYSTLVAACRGPWKKLVKNSIQQTDESLSVTIVVVARNEAGRIGPLMSDLAHQQYAGDWQVLLMDDGSTDNTVKEAKETARRDGLMLEVLPLEVPVNFQGSRKKLAIQQAAGHSSAEVLLFTDADCQVSPEWVATHAARYQQPSTQLVMGSFQFLADGSWLTGLLNLEALNLAGVAAATLAWKKPTMCSGANLSYRRKLVSELQPFEENLHLASGDDEFMMHSVFSQYPNGISYLHEREALVVTHAPAGLRELFNQRRRWSGKWPYYKLPWPRYLAWIVFGGNLGMAILFFTWIFGGLPVTIFGGALAFKGVVEWRLSRAIADHFDQNKYLWYYPLMEIIYPLYAVFFGIASNFGKFHWKGRRYQ